MGVKRTFYDRFSFGKVALKWPYSAYMCRASVQKFDFFSRFCSPPIGCIRAPIRGSYWGPIGGEMGVKRAAFPSEKWP